MKLSHPIILLLSAVIPSSGQDVSITTGFAGTNTGKSVFVFVFCMRTFSLLARPSFLNLPLFSFPLLANGNIFTIKAKTQSIAIKSFDINMSGPPAPNPAPVEVYFAPGIDPGSYQPSSFPYQLIFQGDITGEGTGNVTSLPDFATPVVIPAGATYSFYITVANLWLGTNLWYNIGSQVGSIVASDDNLEIGEGYAVAYPFLGYSAQRRWNGKYKRLNIILSPLVPCIVFFFQIPISQLLFLHCLTLQAMFTTLSVVHQLRQLQQHQAPLQLQQTVQLSAKELLTLLLAIPRSQPLLPLLQLLILLVLSLEMVLSLYLVRIL